MRAALGGVGVGFVCTDEAYPDVLERVAVRSERRSALADLILVEGDAGWAIVSGRGVW
jgi:hypothetical protein